MLELNTRYTFTLPEGSISSEGIRLIMQYIQTRELFSDEWKNLNPDTKLNYLPPLPENWAWQWLVGGKGEYVGTFPKRVSKYYWQEHQLKSPTTFVQELGNRARQHSSKHKAYTFDFVNRFNWNAGDFGDAHSCFWGDRKAARKTLEDNKGLAIRFFEGDKGYARAWIMPIGDNRYIVFNGYGHEGNPTLICARVMATWLGLGYKRIELSNYGATSGTLYINGDIGYLIGTSEQTAELDEYDLELPCDDCLSCYSCGDDINEDDSYIAPNGESYCQDCFYDIYDYCVHCDETFYRDDMYYVENEGDICASCLDRHYSRCERCEEYHADSSIIVIEGDSYCDDCAMEVGTSCDNCAEMIKLDHATSTDRGVYCEDCKPKEENEE
jgi:hypothetical protein